MYIPLSDSAQGLFEQLCWQHSPPHKSWIFLSGGRKSTSCPFLARVTKMPASTSNCDFRCRRMGHVQEPSPFTFGLLWETAEELQKWVIFLFCSPVLKHRASFGQRSYCASCCLVYCEWVSPEPECLCPFQGSSSHTCNCICAKEVLTPLSMPVLMNWDFLR